MEYGKIEKLNEFLLYKRISEWNKDQLILEDGTRITIEMSENNCCAWAGGEFSNVKLDAVITHIDIGEQIDVPSEHTTESEVRVVLYHNQNPIAQADLTADAGNGGYYYSVGSFVVNDIHFRMVDA